ncbi:MULTISPECIES: hypothetical protein [unclassified Carboxylicivirga]|uniref:hypothetical protein n=1 Tax=Carboxylicivirga TaxID=1628153 RepID=UPI003D34C3C8
MSTNIQPASGLWMMDVLTTGLNPWLLTVNPFSGLSKLPAGKVSVLICGQVLNPPESYNLPQTVYWSPFAKVDKPFYDCGSRSNN